MPIQDWDDLEFIPGMVIPSVESRPRIPTQEPGQPWLNGDFYVNVQTRELLVYLSGQWMRAALLE